MINTENDAVVSHLSQLLTPFIFFPCYPYMLYIKREINYLKP